MRYTMTGKGYILNNKIPISATDAATDDESDDEILANLASLAAKRAAACKRPAESDRDSSNDDKDDDDNMPIATVLAASKAAAAAATAAAAVVAADAVATANVSSVIKIHKRKRGRPPASTADPFHSPDETSSRGTLDFIIPPPKDFQGFNNPFHTQFTKNHCTDDASGTTSVTTNPIQTLLGIGQQTKPPRLSTSSLGIPVFRNAATKKRQQIQMVRTIKRRLSARDIMIGPNMEVKRRKLRRRSENIEVISTATIHFPLLRADYKDSQSAMRSIGDDASPSSSSSSSSLSSSPATTPLSTPTSLIYYHTPSQPPPSATAGQSQHTGGRRLRKRGQTNYAENPRKPASSVSSSSLSSQFSSAGSLNAAAATIGSSAKNVMLSDFQSKVCAYFGPANRPVFRGKRTVTDGRVQFLVEWKP